MRKILTVSAFWAFMLLTSQESFATPYQCTGLDVEGEELGILSPDGERLSYETFARYSRRKLQIESIESNANLPRITRERFSLDHQESLITRTGKRSKAFSEEAGVEFEQLGELFLRDLRDAIADSDKGKLLERQQESWAPKTEEQRVRSDSFLNLITLRPTGSKIMDRAQAILQEVLISDFEGRAGEGIFNAKFSNDQIRAIVAKAPVIRGAMHDLPGLYDAFLEYASTRNETRFRNRVRYNFSHNGPGRNKDFTVFWGALFKIILPGSMRAAEAPSFFEGTIYFRDGEYRYPEGSAKGWFLHTATDRLSGEVNLLKFIAEAPTDLDAIDIFANSHTTQGVVTQLGWLEGRLQEVASRWKDPSEVEQVRNYINMLKAEQLVYAQAISERVRFAPATEVLVGGKPVNKVVEMSVTESNGTEIVKIKISQAESGVVITAGEKKITRQQLIELLSEKLFSPISSMDPLNQN